jgi:hypothetical protein
VITDNQGEPEIVIAPELTNMQAQVWVAANHRPMMVLDGGRQWVLVYRPHASASVVLQPFLRISDLNKALIGARMILEGSAEKVSGTPGGAEA